MKTYNEYYGCPHFEELVVVAVVVSNQGYVTNCKSDYLLLIKCMKDSQILNYEQKNNIRPVCI